MAVNSKIGTISYLVVMSAAAAVSLVRGLVIAGLLDRADFGTYALAISLGAFLSSILSFGLVEVTWKTYPVYWSSGRAHDALADARGRGLTLAMRTSVVMAVLGFGWYLSGSNWAIGAATGLISGSIASASLFASLNRATASRRLVANATFVRAVLSLTLAVAGFFAFGFFGVLCGEIMASMAGSAYIDWQYRNAMLRGANAEEKFEETVRSNAAELNAGLFVFLGFLAAAAPALLDRSFVAWAFGGDVLGRYAFLMLFVTGANTFAGIIAQHVGPRLLVMEKAGAKVGTQLRFVGRWVLLFWGVWAGGLAAVWMLAQFEPGASYAAKYMVESSNIVSVLVLGALQLSVLFDFLLMSKDREKAILFAGLTYLAAACCLAALALWFNFGVSEIILALAAAKLVHLAAQGAAIRAARNLQNRSAVP